MRFMKFCDSSGVTRHLFRLGGTTSSASRCGAFGKLSPKKGVCRAYPPRREADAGFVGGRSDVQDRGRVRAEHEAVSADPDGHTGSRPTSGDSCALTRCIQTKGHADAGLVHRSICRGGPPGPCLRRAHAGRRTLVSAWREVRDHRHPTRWRDDSMPVKGDGRPLIAGHACDEEVRLITDADGRLMSGAARRSLLGVKLAMCSVAGTPVWPLHPLLLADEGKERRDAIDQEISLLRNCPLRTVAPSSPEATLRPKANAAAPTAAAVANLRLVTNACINPPAFD